MFLLSLNLAASAVVLAASAAANTNFNIQPFKIDLSSEIPRTLSLINNTQLPETPLYPVGQGKGLELDFLLSLRNDWLTTYDWNEQQAALNRFQQYTAVVEGLTVHFVHQLSKDPNAIPLILLHGWGGKHPSLFPKKIKLTPSTDNSAGKNVSYHVVVPSLPGFAFSSPPPLNWSNSDTWRLFNTLMDGVSGTDWGAVVAYDMYSNFNQTVRATHLMLSIFQPPTAEEIAARNITLTADEQVTAERTAAYFAVGQGYFQEHEYKPDDVGLAMYDSPVGQLAWIGTKLKLWRDPQLSGSPPSVLNNTAIITTVSLYYLTHSFLSSIWIYAQNANPWRTDYGNLPLTDAPLLFSQFKYNLALWPEEYVAQTGNLVYYKFHDFGGHFAALDNPPAVIADVREMGAHFVV
ncbi:alpha/beta-hydrolase [Roridomyces roridus]|uniref:Alpha/beta-hydrolase n=1 Tax=Roridomyces roridus TaxID=1738132 RepID=A0AAD7BCS8_9AGAR|nr:alpha/beta-hydrolase [Roridomyces roridus]